MPGSLLAIGLTTAWIVLAGATAAVLFAAERQSSPDDVRRNPSDEGYRYLADDRR